MNATAYTTIDTKAVARLWAWCRRARSAASAPTDQRLSAVRQDFYSALRHIRTPRAERLVTRLLAARTAADLWHLRAEVFTVVAIQHGETEAQARLQHLNRHFPTRAPMSGFAPFGPDG